MGGKGDFVKSHFYGEFDSLSCWNSQGFDTDKVDTDSTYILVRNDFDVLDMARGLEDLTENILSDPRIKASDV
jgi:hypothetical protein